jgi:uncharacterized protein (TIGR01244 family)
MDNMTTFSIVRIVDALWVASQLRPEYMRTLAAAGFRSVINNRPDFEGGANQPTSTQLEAAARAAGPDCRHMPAPSAGHAWGQALSMASTVDALPHPVLAFCRKGRRSTALYRGKGAA